MTAELTEQEARRLRTKLRDAAFTFFLWNLPEKTPSADIVALAEELASEGNEMLMAYYHSKGVPNDR